MKRYFLSGAWVLVLLTSASCDEKLSSITGPTPELAPNLSAIQRTIFSASDPTNRLACVGCHTDQGRTPASNLNLLEGRSHSQLVGRASVGKPGSTLVIPGDPDNSYLIKKLEGTPDIVGLRMPRNNGPFLSDGQILVIRKWIQDGAQNN